jgi:hypothetical protein
MTTPLARRAASLFSVLAGLAFTAFAVPSVGMAKQVQWQGVERIVAFADVHGAYTELTSLLQSVGIVDTDLRWTGGRTHLVSLGDLLDRGDESRKVMDLLMRLQQEAAAAGGRVHVVVGNHEAMNVLGDLRYVTPGEFSSYVSDEDPALRAERKAGFLAAQPGATEAEFDRLFPPGYFGHRKLLGPEGSYGKWILSQPVAIMIDDTVYMHGGPSTALGNRGIEQLDRDYAAAVSNYLSAEQQLSKAGLLQFQDDYGRRADMARTRLDAMPPGQAKTALEPVVTAFKAADEDALLGPTGPNWYRGAAFCNECAEADVLKPFLQRAGARRLVIGHTVARNGTAVTRFDGAVVKLDAGMNRAVYKGRPAALITEASGTRVAYANPTVAPAPLTEEPLYLSSQTIDEDEVATILAKGTIEVSETCAPGVLGVKVTLDGRRVSAVFEAAPDETVKHELAAYRLDRLLGLGLVPATVARSHGGLDGVLQGRPASYVSEADRQNAQKGVPQGLVCQTISAAPQATPARRPAVANARPPRMPAGGWCNLEAQFQLSYGFDALIANRGRSFDRFLYDADASTLFLSGHGAAFDDSTRLPKPLEGPLAKTGPELQSRLAALDAAAVEAAIGNYVSKQQVKALLARRDAILGLARGTPAR